MAFSENFQTPWSNTTVAAGSELQVNLDILLQNTVHLKNLIDTLHQSVTITLDGRSVLGNSTSSTGEGNSWSVSDFIPTEQDETEDNLATVSAIRNFASFIVGNKLTWKGVYATAGYNKNDLVVKGNQVFICTNDVDSYVVPGQTPGWEANWFLLFEDRTSKLVTKNNHGFSVGSPIYFDRTNSSWELAIADSVPHLASHVVRQIVSVNDFYITTDGYIEELDTGRSQGFLSQTIAGSIVDIMPSTGIVQSIFHSGGFVKLDVFRLEKEAVQPIPENIFFNDGSNALAPLTTPPTYAKGKVWYDDVTQRICYYNQLSYKAKALGNSLTEIVYNDTGAIIPKGTICYITGFKTFNGNDFLTVDRANASVKTRCSNVGILIDDIDVGGLAEMVFAGPVTGLNFSSLEAGIVYVSADTAGTLTNIEPAFPNYSSKFGRIIKNTTNGSIFVLPDTDPQYQASSAPGSVTGGATYPLLLSNTHITLNTQPNMAGYWSTLFIPFSTIEITKMGFYLLTKSEFTGARLGIYTVGLSNETLQAQTVFFVANDINVGLNLFNLTSKFIMNAGTRYMLAIQAGGNASQFLAYNGTYMTARPNLFASSDNSNYQLPSTTMQVTSERSQSSTYIWITVQ